MAFTVWLRELAGWILLGTGLAAFAICYVVFLLNRQIIEAAGLTFMGFTIFRGGLHLLKVAVAARAAVDARQVPAPAAKPKAIRVPITGSQPTNRGA